MGVTLSTGRNRNNRTNAQQGAATNANKPVTAQQTSSAIKTGGNTLSAPYLDTFFTESACKKDLDDVTEHCTPRRDEIDPKTGKKKPRNIGLREKISKVTEVIDTLGKTAAGYKQDLSKTAFDGNGWMAEGCTGAWVTPFSTKKVDEAKATAKDLENNKKVKAVKDGIEDMLKKIEDDRLSLLFSSLSSLKAMALAAAKAKAEELLQNLLFKVVVKGFFGAVLVETGVGPVIMGGWTALDILDTAKQLAALVGPKGEAIYQAMIKIKNIDEEAKKILDMYSNNPHRAQADAMSLLAQINPCMRARKCLLIPYKNTTPDSIGVPDAEAQNKASAQARHGKGCCPGQTGHHIIPNAMMEGVKCAAYNYEEAPTICLEGTKNGFEHGSHGLAHKGLSESIKDYKKSTKQTKLTYEEAKKQGIDAVVKAGAAHCNRKCLEAQLDKHYGPCKDEMLNANAGTGAAVKASPPAALPATAPSPVIPPVKKTSKR